MTKMNDYEESYTTALAKSEDIGEIKIRVAIPTPGGSFNWALLKKRAKNLKEAKEFAAEFFEQHPEHVRGAK